MSSRVVDKDKGAKALLKRLERLDALRITVGIHGEEAGAATRGGLSLGEVAEIHEFGMGVPQRSFLRAWADAKEAEIRSTSKRRAEAVVKGLAPDAAADQLGLWAVGSVQGGIADGIPPPNAPATIKRKGSATPLIDTGQLRSSIRHKVEADG